MCFLPEMSRVISSELSRQNSLLDDENTCVRTTKRFKLNEAATEDSQANKSTHAPDSQREVFAEVGNRCNRVQLSERQALSRVTSKVPSQVVQDEYYSTSEYAHLIFANYWRFYQTITHDNVGDYLAFQLHLTALHRTAIIEWLLHVHTSWKLVPESFFGSVNLFDRFMARFPHVKVKKLQLVGICCLLIAAKYEEADLDQSPGSMMYICDYSYTIDEILQTEVLILNTVNFDLFRPSALTFRLYMASVANSTQKQVFFAHYLLELSLVDYYASTRHKPAELAAGALLVSYRVITKGSWPAELSALTGFTELRLAVVSRYLSQLASEQSLTGVRRKFESARFMSVSLLRL